MNSVVAGWVRVRLRTAPGAAAALALLVAVTACLAAAFPLALDRYEDAGLARAVGRATPARTTLSVVADAPDARLTPRQREQSLLPPALGRQFTGVLGAVPRPLATDLDQSSYGVLNSNDLAVFDRWIPQPSGLPAKVRLVAQHGLGEHSSVRAGRLPRASGVTARTTVVEAAVSVATARSLRIEVGSVIHVPTAASGPALSVRVTGIVAPRGPGGAYWAAKPLMSTPALMEVPAPELNPPKYWLGALLLPPEAAPALLGTDGRPVRYWQPAFGAGALHARDLGRLKSAIASLESGPGLAQVRSVTDQTARAGTDLDDILGEYDRLRSGVGPLVSVAVVGGAAVAVVVLLMAGGLAVDRRRAELTLLRARGASLRGLAGRLLAETAVVAVPAGALGCGAALLVVPGGRPTSAIAAAMAVTAVACAALPLRAAAAHRAVRLHGPREDTVSHRPSRRRTVAELTLLVIAAGAVEALRRRGVSGGPASTGATDPTDPTGATAAAGPSGDQLVSLAPVLVGVIAALVLVRLYPLPLRRLMGPAGRLRGPVGHLALARAGRTSVSATLPLLALLTALTTAAFGGSVLAGVADARDRTALLGVGADARVEVADALSAESVGRVRRTPGVRGLTEVGVDYQAKAGAHLTQTPLAGVVPADYAALAARTGVGAFPAQRLRQPAAGRGTPLPALASPSVAGTYGTRPFPVRLGDGTTVTVRIAVVRDRTPAVPGADFLVVDRAGLSGGAARPSTLLLTGDHLDADALRRAAGSSATVHLRSVERARYVDSPLQSGAERIYTTAVAAGAGYAVLALLLALLRAAPERTALLARLRTMGLTRAQGRRLLVLESLPQALLAAAGGALTGWATIRLLSPGIDLTAIALPPATASGGNALRTDPLSLALPSAAVLLLTVGIAVGQAWWTSRRGSVRELRAGDGG
ncbi:FtsX-like permease family protein [Streptomyces sp. NPDC015220]|uniref:FtsX-like permease family protein n=1 Tax=Streptomyces sp. NPDC015220 TaxID=3364947 RepID=UPI003700AE59